MCADHPHVGGDPLALGNGSVEGDLAPPLLFVSSIVPRSACVSCLSYPNTCKPCSELMSGDLLLLMARTVKLFTVLHTVEDVSLLNTIHGLDLGKVIHCHFCSLHTFRIQPVLTLIFISLFKHIYLLLNQHFFVQVCIFC